LAGMRYLVAFSTFVLLTVCGCSTTPPADTAGAELALGPSPVYVLSAPTRIEGWNFVRPDGSMMTDAPIRQLDKSLAKELAGVLLDGNSYRLPARGGGFERTVGFQVWRNDRSIEFYFSFGNDQMLIKDMGYTGQPVMTTLGVTAAHDALMAIARKAFPDFKGGVPK